MTNIEQPKEKLHTFIKHRGRHHNHTVGETLYYKCPNIGYRPGEIIQVIGHYGMNYYVLEVETGPPLNESFLQLVSEFNVRGEDETF